MNRNIEFEFVTFDCYGTLIDWETGIQRAFKQALKGTGLGPTQEARLFDLYQEEEKKVERQTPYRKYREILSLAVSGAARKFGKNIPEKLSGILSEQLPSWAPFPDTNHALERLATKYRLGILSNIDNDLLSGTLKNFSVPFELLVTAENVRSYKPRPKHFLEAKTIIGDRSWLHVAASIYHDIEPSLKLGICTVWVNRKGSDEGRDYSTKIVKEVANLTQLADWLVS